MPPFTAPPLPEGCPWSGWTPPNIDWCEAELCAWVTNPANTWSNAAYIVFGLWMVWEAHRRQSRTLALFGPASIAVGIFSFAYHASYTWFLQFFDFVGMFLFCFLVLVLNARRLGWVDADRQTATYLLGVAGMSALVPLLFYQGIAIQPLVGVLIAIVLVQEGLLLRRDGTTSAHPWLAAALLLLGGAAFFSLLDVTRTWCDPDDHWLQGHALWHLLSAASLLALFGFYGRLEAGPTSRGARA